MNLLGMGLAESRTLCASAEIQRQLPYWKLDVEHVERRSFHVGSSLPRSTQLVLSSPSSANNADGEPPPVLGCGACRHCSLSTHEDAG